MTTHADEEAVFNAALECAPGEARMKFLDEACANNPKFRQRIEQLLAADSEGFCLQAPSTESLRLDLLRSIGERPGDTIGPYKLLEQIGEGGMGLVFMAEQIQPLRRRVALKIIKPGLDTRSVIARFEAERQALALMDHPNIARVYDAGATESGRPFFVMELVRGAPITDYCRDRKLKLRERLELFIDVCQAVQHAHQKGVIHRDVKPTNILVAQSDTASVAKVIDFGVAKATTQPLTEQTYFTAFSQIIGTPLYMSPEQADLGNQDVDTRSDVYSLGVVLYELLTDLTPFDATRLRSVGYDEMRRILREEEPPKPSSRLTTNAAARSTISTTSTVMQLPDVSALRGELDWIVMKALDKDRRRRYQSALELAEDLKRYLNQDDVLACPPTFAYRLTKLVRRNRQAFGLAAGGLLCLLAAMTAVSGAWLHQREATRVALVERDEQRYLRYVADMNLANTEYRQGRLGSTLSRLNSYATSQSDNKLRNWEWYFLVSQCHEEFRCLRNHESPVTAVAYSPDGRFLATGDHDGLVLVWAIDASAEPTRLRGCKDAVADLAWNFTGKKLAAGSHDGVVTVWNVETTSVIRRLTRNHASSCYAVAWGAGAERLAAAMEIERVRGSVVVWDETADPPLEFKEEASPTELAWSRDGKTLAYATDSTNHLDRHVVVRSIESGQRVMELATPSAPTLSLDISPDGKYLAVGRETDGLRIYEIETGELDQELSANAAGVSAVRWHPDGLRLAAGGSDGALRVWELTSGRVARTFAAHELDITDLDWNRDGCTLASASSDRTVKLWRPESLGAQGRFSDFVVMDTDPRGMQLATRAESPTRYPIVDSQSGETLLTIEHQGSEWARDAAWSPDGRYLAIAPHREDEHDPEGFIINLKENRVVATFPGGRHVTWSPNGRQLAVTLARGSDAQINLRNSSVSHAVAIIAFPSGKEVTRLKGPAWFGAVRWSPDGKYLAAFNTTLHVQLWNATTWRLGPRFELHPESPRLEGSGGLSAIDWSPDSRFLAGVSSYGRLCIWDVALARERQRVVASAQAIVGVRWSPDGGRLATFALDRELKLWDPTTGRQLMSTQIDDRGAWDLRWGANGKKLFLRCDHGTHCLDASVGFDRAERGMTP